MNIYQRIDKVRADVAYIRKDKQVETYWAVTHDMVTAELRPYLIQHGIVMVIRQTSGTIADTGKATKYGTPITRYEAMYEIDYVNIEDPTDKITTVIGSVAEDQGDKAPGKCVSYAVKYSMLKTFNIETGEGDESRIDAKPMPITEEQLITLREVCEAKGFEKENAENKLKSLAERVYQLKAITDLPQKYFDDAVSRLEKMPEYHGTEND